MYGIKEKPLKNCISLISSFCDRTKYYQHIVEGNRELIRLYEEKVKKVIERVWES